MNKASFASGIVHVYPCTYFRFSGKRMNVIAFLKGGYGGNKLSQFDPEFGQLFLYFLMCDFY